MRLAFFTAFLLFASLCFSQAGSAWDPGTTTNDDGMGPYGLDKCSRYISCNSCTPVTANVTLVSGAYYYCGWSFSKKKCLRGNSNGTIDSYGRLNGLSSGSDWAFKPSQCLATGPDTGQGPWGPDLCGRYPACASCTPASANITLSDGQFYYCGWSVSLNKCLRGNATGSKNSYAQLDGISTGSDWVYSTSDCPAAPNPPPPPPPCCPAFIPALSLLAFVSLKRS